MPLASGATGTQPYSSEDVAYQKAYKQDASGTGSTSGVYTGSANTSHQSFEATSLPPTGAVLAVYDPEVASILAGEFA